MSFCCMAILPNQKENGPVKSYSKQSPNISLLWLCIVIVGLALVLTNTNPKKIDLGVIYDCTKVTHIDIFDYPPLSDYNHSMSKTNDAVRIYIAEIHKYEPTVSKFYIRQCQCSTITRTCYYKNTSKESTISINKVE